ncbi:hypothetical protein HanPSC8_Chr09g0379711 [Helianthus annuus]|nr:hypothetical protein HanPSC8_Chr09g0379711 [Helianthus annuus]
MTSARRGSADRRWFIAAEISPGADKGLMTFGMFGDDREGFRRRFLVAVVGEGVVVEMTMAEASASAMVVDWGLSCTVVVVIVGGDESLRIFWGRIGILEGFEGVSWEMEDVKDGCSSGGG